MFESRAKRLALSAVLSFVPLSIILGFLQVPIALLFVVSGIAILPLAYLMGLATEELGKHVGPGLGGLLNASFGNATDYHCHRGLASGARASGSG